MNKLGKKKEKENDFLYFFSYEMVYFSFIIFCMFSYLLFFYGININMNGSISGEFSCDYATHTSLTHTRHH